LRSEPVGQFIFGLEATQEGLQSQFYFIMGCARYKRSWTKEQGKVTEIDCEKDIAMSAGKKKLQENKKA
jgi:hypothetical protein